MTTFMYIVIGILVAIIVCIIVAFRMVLQDAISKLDSLLKYANNIEQCVNSIEKIETRTNTLVTQGNEKTVVLFDKLNSKIDQRSDKLVNLVSNTSSKIIQSLDDCSITLSEINKQTIKTPKKVGRKPKDSANKDDKDIKA